MSSQHPTSSPPPAPPPLTPGYGSAPSANYVASSPAALSAHNMGVNLQVTTTTVQPPISGNAVANAQMLVNGNSYSSGPSAEDQKKYQQSMAFKHIGIAGFTQFMDCSNDCFVIRRFGQMNARVILLLQDRITRKEAELLDHDERTRQSPSNNACNNSFRKDIGSQREQILDEIKDLLKEYNDFVSTYSDLKTRRSASENQIENVVNWFNTYPNAVRKDPDPNSPGYENEQVFIEQSGDLITLVSKDRSPISWLFQKSCSLISRHTFRSTARNVHTKDSTAHLISARGFENEFYTTSFTILVGLLLLFGPIWWLHFVSSDIFRLAIITGFVTVFTILCALATVPRPFEVLAASAAYSAVLLVYLQISKKNA